MRPGSCWTVSATLKESADGIKRCQEKNSNKIQLVIFFSKSFSWRVYGREQVTMLSFTNSVVKKTQYSARSHRSIIDVVRFHRRTCIHTSEMWVCSWSRTWFTEFSLQVAQSEGIPEFTVARTVLFILAFVIAMLLIFTVSCFLFVLSTS